MAAGIDVGQTLRRRAGLGRDDEQIRRRLRIGVLIDEPRAVGRPERRDVGAAAGRQHREGRLGRVGADRRDADVARPGLSGSLASNAIRVLSGDQLGRHASNSPLVICTASPPRLA